MKIPKLALAALVTVALAMVAWPIAAQQTVTSTYPVLQQNLTQWGTTSITTAAALSDALANPTTPQLGSNSLLWDTTQWVRRRAAALNTFTAATTLTSRNSIGAGLVEKGSRWAVYSNPAAGSQGTASIAAEASVRHVVDCISFSASATAAPAATALTIQLRDGATGAGTVVQQWAVAVTASTGTLVAPFGLCDLNLTGTTNTAMTLEYSSALANLVESVNITGYNVN